MRKIEIMRNHSNNCCREEPLVSAKIYYVMFEEIQNISTVSKYPPQILITKGKIMVRLFCRILVKMRHVNLIMRKKKTLRNIVQSN